MGQGNLSKRKNLNTGEIAESVKKSLKEMQAIDGKFTEINNNIDGKISEVKTALESKADIRRKTATPEWKESDGSYRAEARLDECTEAGLYEVDCAVGIIKTNYPLYPSQGEPSIIGSWTVNDARAYVFVSVNEPNDEKNMRAGYPKQIQQVCIGMKNDRLKMRTGNIESEDAGVVWEEWVSLDNLFTSVAEANSRLEALEATDSELAEAEKLQESYLGGDEG